jgi:hypothetical protein
MIVVNIDKIGGIAGIQQLLNSNPHWTLITCGTTNVDRTKAGWLGWEAVDAGINFAVFSKNTEYTDDFVYPSHC